jgi:hypothetical protein
MNEDYQRKSDLELTSLSQKFADFVERYDRDCGASGEWRRTVEMMLKEHGAMLSDITPAYTRGKWIAGIIAIGSIGIAVKTFWSHIVFK